MKRHAILASVICLSCASWVVAQQPELPKPGPEHQKLGELVGDWDAVMEMGPMKTNGKMTYKSICGGMWVQSDFEGDVAGQKFSGHGLDGYDSAKKKFVSIWTDSMDSAPMLLEGNFEPANSKTMVMTGESKGPDGKPMKVKTTTEMKDKDHLTFKMFM